MKKNHSNMLTAWVKWVLPLFLLAFLPLPIMAQQADFQKAVARYKNAKTVTANVTKRAHKDAVANDAVTKGTFLMKAPNEVSITMEGGKDQLIMQGNNFTMVANGRKHKTDSQKNIQFASFQAVFESILSGGTKSISQLKDLTMKKNGTLLVLTITPQPDSKKAARRMMFTSFVLTIDTKTSEIRSLRMNERSGYTEYTFSGYKF